MSEINNHIDCYELIAKYLAGEAKIDEIQWLEGWIEENPSNKKILDEQRMLWEKVEKVRNEQYVNIEEEWKILQEEIKEQEEKTKLIHIKRKKLIKKILWIIGLLLLGVIIVLLYLFKK